MNAIQAFHLTGPAPRSSRSPCPSARWSIFHSETSLQNNSRRPFALRDCASLSRFPIWLSQTPKPLQAVGWYVVKAVRLSD
jgi:hypothetical protein